MSVWKGFGAFACAIAMGCGGFGYNEATGGDGTRGDAADIPTNATMDDRVSAGQGDHSDWKRFTTDVKTKVTVQVWWDDADVTSRVTLRDELGKEVSTVKHAKGSRTDTLGPIEIPAGTYYLEFAASAGASVYTFEVRAGMAGPVLPDL